MFKSLALAALLLTSFAAIEASAKEPTNSGTASLLAEQVRAGTATRAGKGYQAKATLPVNWAQDHWR